MREGFMQQNNFSLRIEAISDVVLKTECEN